jgi:hypothetical protein
MVLGIGIVEYLWHEDQQCKCRFEGSKEQLSLDAKKAELQSKYKQEKRAKLLLTARKALDKHESSPVTMTDKDWIDFRYWVLPESKAPGLMKEDVRKKMQSSQNSYLLRAIGNRTYRV